VNLTGRFSFSLLAEIQLTQIHSYPQENLTQPEELTKFT
jgi:hypothetical protein